MCVHGGLSITLQRIAIACYLACVHPTIVTATEPDSIAATAHLKTPANSLVGSEGNTGSGSKDKNVAHNNFSVPDGFAVQLIAAEPLVVNPVAFCFDNRGRLFVAETFRLGNNRGVEDNTYHQEWLDDDLAARTVADRLAYIKKHHGDTIATYTANSDRIRLLEDRDSDGTFETASVYADGFNDVVDGAGAGVMSYGDRIFYTCIPNLWALQDNDGDGQADDRKPLHHGYGVHTSLMGHDLHGLCVGPDGKVYFSIGDRGYHIESEGRTIADPDSGAVFRCNADGSELEVFATGLRNPQSLAFDQYGNLFTCDNNSDSGDKARWVYVVEGGDSGWRMAYQYLPDRGPFNREYIWHTQRPDQPAYIVPPVGHIADGPAGLAYFPGTGMPAKYDEHFFLSDFRGTPNQSGIHCLSVKPKGAGFEIADRGKFLWSILATHVDFGPDGGLYASDWVESWNGVNKGRIYRVENVAASQRERSDLDRVKVMLKDGMTSRTILELADLLRHRNMKVRQAAQLELAERGASAAPMLAEVATNSDSQLARIHALWALGQISIERSETLDSVCGVLARDTDLEIRAQVARVLGWHPHQTSAKHRRDSSKLLASRLLGGENGPRVQSLAAVSLGKLGTEADAQASLNLLEYNADRDAIVRHCASSALAVLPLSNENLAALATSRDEATRMGVLIALRRRRAPEIKRFLRDPASRLVEEAARAIYDLPIEDAMPMLASVLDRPSVTSELLLRRALHANSRLGSPQCANRLATVAADRSASDAVRIEALEVLGNWSRERNRDPILGDWRPRKPRDSKIAADALRSVLSQFADAPEAVINQAFISADLLSLDQAMQLATIVFNNPSQPSDSRSRALQALDRLSPAKIDDFVSLGLHDTNADVRSTARQVLARRDADAALIELQRAIASGEMKERQQALETLTEIDAEKTDPLLASFLGRLVNGKWPAEVELELLSAVERSTDKRLQSRLKEYNATRDKSDPVSTYRECLNGGDAERGKRIFLERTDVACLRCHRINPGEECVGPNLSGIGVKRDRSYLLSSIVDPNRNIAEGFESIVVVLESGIVKSGMVKFENDDSLQIVDAEGRDVAIAKSDIEDRFSGISAMPEGLAKSLSKTDLRDLVEFLSQQK